MTIFQRNLKKVVLLFLLVGISTLAYGGGNKEKAPAKEDQAPATETQGTRTPINLEQTGDLVARVNGTGIERKRFDQLVAAQQQYAAGQGMRVTEQQIGELKEYVLEELINNELLAQEADKAGYKADRDALEQQIGQIRGQFETEDAFLQAMASEGITEETLRSDLGKSLAVQQFVMEEFAPQVSLDEGEAKAFYDSNQEVFLQQESVRASHILLSLDDDAEESKVAEVRAEAEKILGRYRDGEEFSDLASEFSSCPSSAQGGDLGFFERNQMVKEFEDAAFSMEVGSVSEPVRTQFGFHLIRLTAKNESGAAAYEEVQQQIEQYLAEMKLNEMLESFLQEKRSEAKIERLL